MGGWDAFRVLLGVCLQVSAFLFPAAVLLSVVLLLLSERLVLIVVFFRVR